MKKTHVVAFISGFVFACGLALGGMTRPVKVIAFLDVAGAWDPSLAFVMAGAVTTLFLGSRWAQRDRPRFAPSYALPSKTRIDGRLLVGAALFGVGWGLAGVCPGPAVVSLVTLQPAVFAFVAAMLVGMSIHHLLFERARPSERRRTNAKDASASAS